MNVAVEAFELAVGGARLLGLCDLTIELGPYYAWCERNYMGWPLVLKSPPGLLVGGGEIAYAVLREYAPAMIGTGRASPRE